ncbi:MAG TPA: DUF3418 domain-containing protein, partial [Tepidisphaeraceae bacterium]
GICIRLYSEADFANRSEYAEPEILRTNLASVILQMKWLRLGRVEDFPFIDPPDFRQIRDGLNTLHELGAIDDRENLTETGKRLAKLPVDPRVGRMIVAGQDEDCLDAVLVIAAALSVSDVRERPADRADAADQTHATFRDDQSDFISILKLWRAMRREQRDLSNNQFRKWCRSKFLSYMRYREWSDVHQQLISMTNVRPGRSTSQAIRPVADPKADPFPQTERDAIHRALLCGLLSNIGMKADAASYTGARGTKLSIWPGSTLFRARPPWIMGAELIETTRLYVRTVAPVRVEWIERSAKHLVKQTYFDPHWHSQTAHVLAFEKVTLFGLMLVPKRSIHYGPIDPVQSRQLFIQHALVDNDFRTDHPATIENRRRVRMVLAWQEKLRRRDILSDSQTRYDFFDARVPHDVYSGPTFDNWARRGRGSNTHDFEMPDLILLRQGVAGEVAKMLSTSALTPPSANAPDAQANQLGKLIEASHPDHLQLPSIRVPLVYAYEPGEDFDGVTALAPLSALGHITDARAEWLVPGMVREKVEALIRSLPKRLRTKFLPIPQTTDAVIAKLPQFGVGSFNEQVAGLLWRIGGDPITAADFQAEQIPPHLFLNVRVLGPDDRVLAEGRDLAALRAKLGQQVRQQINSLADPRYTRDDLSKWDFGDLPQSVPVTVNDAIISGYPTLVEEGTKVSLRLLDSQEASDKLMPAGLRRLFMTQTAREIKNVLRDLPGLESLRLNYRPFGTGEELMDDLARLTADRAFSTEIGPIRTQAAFADRSGIAWKRMYEVSRHAGKQLTEVLDRYRVLSALLFRDYPPLLVDSIDDMRRQFKALLPKRFLSAFPGHRVEQLPRYLKGIDSRLTRLTNAGLAKDLQAMSVIRPLMEQYRDRAAQQQKRGIIDPAMEEYRWLLEELRISLFAQDIKTSVPVSPKRLEQVWLMTKSV